MEMKKIGYSVAFDELMKIKPGGFGELFTWKIENINFIPLMRAGLSKKIVITFGRGTINQKSQNRYPRIFEV